MPFIKAGLWTPSEVRLACFALLAFAGVVFMLCSSLKTSTPTEAAPIHATWGMGSNQPDLNPSIPRPSFHQLAARFGSHKATTHQYHRMYEKYFPAIRDRSIKLLEIGLGCDEYAASAANAGQPANNNNNNNNNNNKDDSTGAAGIIASENSQRHPTGRDVSRIGASYHTFVSYFPKLSLTYIEKDTDCVSDFTSQNDKALVFVGDQGDSAFLDNVAQRSTVHGLYDIIIDDGGGTDALQERSIRDLWGVVRPGGVYFVEGVRSKGDKSVLGEGGDTRTFGEFVDELLWEDVMLPDGEVESVDCMLGICAFFKKAA